jgi:hypothetical protein
MGKTVAIVDFAHSGTTMLAGICEILGVPMVGEFYKPMKWEDLEIIQSLRDEDKFAAVVAQRNSKYDTWGFKYPGAWKFMPILERHLREPVYLAIFKEPVSVTRRRFGANTMSKLANTIEQFKLSVDGMMATGKQIHMLSYHVASVAPLQFVVNLALLLGLQPTNGQLDCAVQFMQPNRGDPRKPYPAVMPWI